MPLDAMSIEAPGSMARASLLKARADVDAIEPIRNCRLPSSDRIIRITSSFYLFYSFRGQFGRRPAFHPNVSVNGFNPPCKVHVKFVVQDIFVIDIGFDDGHITRKPVGIDLQKTLSGRVDLHSPLS